MSPGIFYQTLAGRLRTTAQMAHAAVRANDIGSPTVRSSFRNICVPPAWVKAEKNGKLSIISPLMM